MDEQTRGNHAGEGRVFTVHLPEDGVDGPIYVDGYHCLAAIVTRETVIDLSSQWRHQGAYALIGPETIEARDVYVGVSDDGGLASRVRGHVYAKPWWTKAVLFQGVHTNRPLDGAMARYLESALYTLLADLPHVNLQNRVRPVGGRSLYPWDRKNLDAHVLPDIMGALYMAGVPTRKKTPALTRLSLNGEQVASVRRGGRAAGDYSMRLTARDLDIFRFLYARGEATYPDLAEHFSTSVNALRQRFPKLQSNDFIEHAGRHRSGAELWRVTEKGRKEIGEFVEETFGNDASGPGTVTPIDRAR